MKEAHDWGTRDISEGTPVRLGLLVLIIGMIGGGLAGSIWWASRTSTQLEGISSLLIHLQTNDSNQAKDISDLQASIRVLTASGSPSAQLNASKLSDVSDRVRILETQGSPALVPRISALEQNFIKLKEDMEVHKAADDSRFHKSQSP